ncbi:hypothetical protein AN639_05885 [Candidatus Epulonipiscium fishelsonii]|nr:hypothetical protein AN639_05885 [Epulopiscium sp. SCG-B05WGA-EpuloA1]
MNKSKIVDTFGRMYRNSTYKVLMFILGFFTMMPIVWVYNSKKGKDEFTKIKNQLEQELQQEGIKLYQEAIKHLTSKNKYFNQSMSAQQMEKEAQAIANRNFSIILHDLAVEKANLYGVSETTMKKCFEDMLGSPILTFFSILISWT